MTTADAQRRLKELSHIIPRNFDDLITLSKEIIDCWINAGFAYPSDLVEVFVSIDSQADHLRASDDAEDKQDFYQAFRAVYVNELEALKRFLDRPRG